MKEYRLRLLHIRRRSDHPTVCHVEFQHAVGAQGIQRVAPHLGMKIMPAVIADTLEFRSDSRHIGIPQSVLTGKIEVIATQFDGLYRVLIFSVHFLHQRLRRKQRDGIDRHRLVGRHGHITLHRFPTKHPQPVAGSEITAAVIAFHPVIGRIGIAFLRKNGRISHTTENDILHQYAVTQTHQMQSAVAHRNQHIVGTSGMTQVFNIVNAVGGIGDTVLLQTSRSITVNDAFLRTNQKISRGIRTDTRQLTLKHNRLRIHCFLSLTGTAGGNSTQTKEQQE